MVNAAEFAIDPGDPEDDDIFVLGPPNTNTDEDDHDPAGFEVFDLMLDKSVVNPQPYYVVGDVVPFNIRVTNQGRYGCQLHSDNRLPSMWIFIQCGYQPRLDAKWQPAQLSIDFDA